jgi:hypothetical protein
VWSSLASKPTADEIQAYLNEFPAGQHASACRRILATMEAVAIAAREESERALRETKAWTAVATSAEKTETEEFLGAWPKGEHAGAAKRRLRELAFLQSKTRFGTLSPVIVLGLAWLGLAWLGLAWPALRRLRIGLGPLPPRPGKWR